MDCHSYAMQQLEKALITALVLRKPNYACGRPIIVMVDTSLIGISGALSQEDTEGNKYAIRFGAKVLSPRQRSYTQIMRELWGMVTTLKTNKDYLIGVPVIVKTDCLS
jgi:hypothetical protein